MWILKEVINKITDYDPTDSRLNPNDLTKKGVYVKEQIYQYGNNVTYTIKSDGKVWYKGSKAIPTEQQSNKTKFWNLGESSNIIEPYTIKSTYYYYFPETLGSFSGSSVASGQTMDGISMSSPAYDMLFKPQSNVPYWLASTCVYAREGYVLWSLFIVNSFVYNGDLWYSGSGSSSRSIGVHPVVSLKSTITPTLKSTDESTGISTYEI